MNIVRRGRRPVGPIRVLIVDDDAGIRLGLRALLEVEGIEVIGAAADGIQGLALALERRPSVIVLDYQMPIMDGGETSIYMRRVVPEARIISFSATYAGCPPWADAAAPKDDPMLLLEIVTRAGVLDPEHAA